MTVFCSEETRGVQGIGGRCGNRATVEHNGKAYCTRHSPGGVARRGAIERKAVALGEAMSKARSRLRQAESSALAALLAWDGSTTTDALWAVRQLLIAAAASYDKAKSAANENSKVPRSYYRY